ncbi:MAG: general secretion pathway protein GspB, partial [Desulfobacterales bacterium]|nr:general secretion pathway protein GspB [Desulfobacterales bacterium]
EPHRETIPETPPGTAPGKTTETTPGKLPTLSKPSVGPDPPPPPDQPQPVEAAALDRELKLQAIAWSEDPARRIAVINGRIIREGGAVGGVVVDRIDRDAVVLRAEDDRGAWTLEFKRE